MKGIHWESQILIDKYSHPALCEELIDVANMNGLSQLQYMPTHEQSTTDVIYQE